MAIISRGNANDTVFGTSEPDSVDSGGGNDTVSTGCYDDELVGGTGADSLNGGHGDDVLFDGDGAFSGAADLDADTLNGGVGDDQLYGGIKDRLLGGVGFDEATLDFAAATTNVYLDFRSANNGGAANFSLVTGEVGQVSGIEELNVTTGTGADTVIHGDFAGRITTGNGADIVIALGGADTIETGLGNDFVEGGLGDDSIDAAAGRDTLDGGDGDDRITTIFRDGMFQRIADDGEVDGLFGGAGDDVLVGSSRDLFDGGAGVEDGALVVFTASTDTYIDLRGVTAGTTYFTGAGGSVVGVEQIGVETQGGDDTVLHNSADGFANTGDGSDLIVMAGGSDTAIGGGGADYVDGGDGDDVLLANGLQAFFDSESLFDLLSSDLDLVFGAQFLTVYTDDDFVADTLLGGAGNDVLVIAAGDFANGGAGLNLDTAVVNLTSQTDDLYLDFTNLAVTPFFGLPGGGGLGGIEAVAIFSGEGNDVLIDTAFQGALDGGGGDDTVVGAGGADYLNGADGVDYVDGGADADTLSGGDGADLVRGGGGNDFISDDDGDADILVGEAGDDVIFADYRDYVDGGAEAGGNDLVVIDFSALTAGVYFDFAAAINDGAISFAQFAGGGSLRGADAGGAQGTAFNDTFLDADWNGVYDGGSGNDVLAGRGGVDSLSGDDGADYIDGGADGDILNGDDGSDTIFGGTGDDVIDGGVFDFDVDPDNDILLGEAGNDVITAGDGLDYIDGGADNDLLNGDGNNDVVIGGAGNDTVFGGCGDDRVTGGSGSDIFVFEGTTQGEFDVVTDFDRNVDRFRIDGGGQFTGLVTGDFDGDGQADDTQLGFSGGNVVVLNLTGLSLGDWNGLLV